MWNVVRGKAEIIGYMDPDEDLVKAKIKKNILKCGVYH